MSIAAMTSKDQVTMRQEIRDELGSIGDYVPRRQRRSMRDLSGILTHDGPPVSVAELNEAVAEDHLRSVVE